MSDKDPVVLAGSSSRELAEKICQCLKLPLAGSQMRRFADGEIWVKIDENVRGRNVFLVHATCNPVNENMMELLLLLDALRRASAGGINAVIPYFGYARQDRKEQPRVPISAKLMANLITTAGATRVIAVDLHSDQIQGFFDIPFDHLSAKPVLIGALSRHCQDGEAVVVSPDVGNVKRTRLYAEALHIPLVIIDKRRPKPNVAEVVNIIGDVRGRTCLIYDDMIDTGGTIVQAAEALRKAGARKVIAFCTHAVFSGPARERLQASCLEEVIVTDTIPHSEDGLPPKVKTLSVARLLAEAVTRVHNHQSVSELFDTAPAEQLQLY
ncbi:MAG: ribose-phosphate pyrophosphokinase [Candidatus Sumerlaeia bacterium]